VPADRAKQMLFHYAQKHKEVVVLYMLSGINRNGIHIIDLVPKDKLEKSKDNLSVIISLHVYSLQNKLNDSTSLYTLDHSEILSMENDSPYSNAFITNKWSAIEFKEGNETGTHRANDELVNNSKKEILRQKEEEKQREDEMSRQERNKRKMNEAEKNKTSKKKSKNVKDVKEPQKGNLTNFFTTVTKESKNSKGYFVVEDVKEPIKKEEPTPVKIEDEIEQDPEPPKESHVKEPKEIIKETTKFTNKKKSKSKLPDPKQGQITSFFKVQTTKKKVKIFLE